MTEYFKMDYTIVLTHKLVIKFIFSLDKRAYPRFLHNRGWETYYKNKISYGLRGGSSNSSLIKTGKNNLSAYNVMSDTALYNTVKF
jgi:hypothetical protein